MSVPDIETSWRRFTEWLAREAPASHGCLNPPARAAEIDDMANGCPDELRTLLLLNNGATQPIGAASAAGFLPGGHRLLSALQVVEHRRMLDGILAGMDQDMVGWWWHPDWIPFAAHVAADALVIDLRDGPHQGAVGEFMHEGNTNFDWGPSLAAVIHDMAESVETGAPFRYFQPRVAGGRLDWHVNP